jgi:hypothetical protein
MVRTAQREETNMDITGLDLDGLKALREPFPESAISKLPRGVAKDGPKQDCSICGSYHRRAAVHLDYVGHAHLTERLLEVDPTWKWTPQAMDEQGLPLIINRNGQAELWINLTVCGLTRPGVGTAPASKEELAKELIGDALRNAAMRFGCALNLWMKGGGEAEPDTVTAQPITPAEIEERHVNQVKADLVDLLGSKTEAASYWLWQEQQAKERGEALDPDTVLEAAKVMKAEEAKKHQMEKQAEQETLLEEETT